VIQQKASSGNTAGHENRESHITMATSKKRRPFIAHIVDDAVDFIKARGLMISELAEPSGRRWRQCLW
jgi:hypothetical protein